MNNNNFPIVVCLATPERKANYQWFEGSEALKSNNIIVETIDGIKSMGVTIPYDATIDDLLMLHPYEYNKYIHIEDVENAMIKATKFFKYSEILQELGAESYKVVSGATKVYQVQTDVKGKVSYKKITTPAELEINVKKTNDFMSKMGFNLTDTFDGVRTISEDSFINANNLVNQYRLQDDEFITSLIKKRDPRKANHNRTELLHYEAMQEFNKCIDVAVAFNAVSIFDFSAKVKHAISEKVEYNLEIEITFPKQ